MNVPENKINGSDVTPRLAGMEDIVRILEERFNTNRIENGAIVTRPNQLLVFNNILDGSLNPGSTILGKVSRIDGNLVLEFNSVGYLKHINKYPEEHVNALKSFFSEKLPTNIFQSSLNPKVEAVNFTNNMLLHMTEMIKAILASGDEHVIIQNENIENYEFPYVLYRTGADSMALFAIHNTKIEPSFAQVGLLIEENRVCWNIYDYWCTPANILNSLIKHINPNATELYPDDNYRGAAPLGIE